MKNVNIDIEKLKHNFICDNRILLLVEREGEYHCTTPNSPITENDLVKANIPITESDLIKLNNRLPAKDIVKENIILSVIINNSYKSVRSFVLDINNENFYFFIKSIYEVFPFFGKYEIFFEAKNFGTVEDFVSKKITKIEDLQFVYHGTSSYYADLIIKNGLKPRKETNVAASFFRGNIQGNENFVYFCSRPTHEITRSAEAAVKKSGGLPNILKIDISGICQSKIKICDKIENQEISLNESLSITSNLVYEGSIRPEFIQNEGLFSFTYANQDAIDYFNSEEFKRKIKS
jgi:hypothetical protein